MQRFRLISAVLIILPALLIFFSDQTRAAAYDGQTQVPAMAGAGSVRDARLPAVNNQPSPVPAEHHIGTGNVVLYLHQQLYRGVNHAFAPSVPGGVTVDYRVKIYNNNFDEFIINYGDKKALLWNLRTDLTRAIPHIGEWNGTEVFLNGRALGIKADYTKSFPVTSLVAGTVAIDWSYNRWMSSKFFFLPDGKHLFVDVPGMGENESLYFIDKIEGLNQTLYYVPSYPGTPVPVLVKDAFQNPTFLDGGKTIVYWRMEGLSADSERRTLVIESLDLASRSVKLLSRFDVAARGEASDGRRSYLRGVPEAIFCTGAPIVLFQKSMQTDSPWYCVNVPSGQETPLDAGHGWTLIPPLGAGRTIATPHAFFGKVVDGRVQLKVLSLPDMSLVYQTSFIPQGVVKYLNSSVAQGVYIPSR